MARTWGCPSAVLAANSLIWHYWEHSYLRGEPLTPLTCCLLERGRHAHALCDARLLPARNVSAQQSDQARSHLTIASGQAIDLDRIAQPLAR